MASKGIQLEIINALKEEEKKNDSWWKVIKSDDKFRIDIRRLYAEDFDEAPFEINVYYKAASFLRIYYLKSKKIFKASIHEKYIGRTEKETRYKTFKLDGLHLVSDDETLNLKKVIADLDTYVTRHYNKKERKFEMFYAKNHKNNILITEYTGEDTDNKNKGNKEKIRPDMVRIENNKIRFIELKLSNNNELYTKSKRENVRNINEQINSYKEYKHKDRLEDGIKCHYRICKELGLFKCKANSEDLKLDKNDKIILMVAELKKDDFRKNKIKNCIIPDVENYPIEIVQYSDCEN